MIACGNGFGLVEVYSPDGRCSQDLGNRPNEVSNLSPALGYINGKITACSRYANYFSKTACYTYDPVTSGWNFLTYVPSNHSGSPGIIYNNKFYIIDTFNPEVYDGTTNTWSRWATPVHSLSFDACTVVWRDSLIVLGYLRYQKYSFTTQTWSNLVTTPPNAFYNPGCLVLPTDEVLVVGSVFNLRQALKFNPMTNTWSTLPNLNVDQGAGSLVQLGSRIFVVGGNNNTAEEFNPTTSTWSTVPFKQKYVHQGYAAALAVPADLFASKPGGCNGI